MIVTLLTFAVLSVVIIAMSIGVIVANKPIKGSCGGLASLGLKEDCPICGGDGKQPQILSHNTESLFYNADKRSS